jgi:glutathione S-transferase
MEPLVLHVDTFWTIPYVFSAFVCLTEKGLPFETREVRLQDREQMTPAFQSMSLTGRVPVLEHGAFRLSESSAIVEYLEDTFPAPDTSRCCPRRGRSGRAPARSWPGFEAI